MSQQRQKKKKKELAGTFSPRAKSLWLQQLRACVGFDVCSFTPNGPRHPFGNYRSVVIIKTEKAAISVFCVKVLLAELHIRSLTYQSITDFNIQRCSDWLSGDVERETEACRHLRIRHPTGGWGGGAERKVRAMLPTANQGRYKCPEATVREGQSSPALVTAPPLKTPTERGREGGREHFQVMAEENSRDFNWGRNKAGVTSLWNNDKMTAARGMLGFKN